MQIEMIEQIYELRSLYVFLSWACNLKCRHCWVGHDAADNTKSLETDDVLNVVKQALPLGLKSVKLSGGEPTLDRSQFLRLVRAFNQLGLHTTVETNGTLIDEEIAESLGQGHCQVAVSLDSADPVRHDAYRGLEGCYDMAVEGLRLLGRYGVKRQILVAVGHDNVSEIEPLIHQGLRLGVNHYGFNVIQPVGSARSLGNVTLDYQEIAAFESQLEELQSRFRQEGMEVSLSCDLVPLPFKKIKTGTAIHPPSCSFLNMLSLVPGGDISICGCYDHKVASQTRVGSIKDDIADLWQSSPILLEARKSIPRKLDGVCSNCLFRDYCCGGCRALALSAGLGLTAPLPYCSAMFSRGQFPVTRLRNIGQHLPDVRSTLSDS